MNKNELVKAVAESANYTQTATAEVVEHVLEEIMRQVAKGERVILTGFGTFEPAYRSARTARNPQTGDAVEVPEKIAPRFKPGATFKNAVNS